MKRRALFCFPLVLGELYLISLPVLGRSQESPFHASCPPLSEQSPAGTVSVYAAKALDAPSILCVRAVNGISPAIGRGGGPFFLQKWEDSTFRNFSPGGMYIGGVLARTELPVGQALDHYLFAGQLTPPGRYRVCFRYDVTLGGEEHIACSEEFSMP